MIPLPFTRAYGDPGLTQGVAITGMLRGGKQSGGQQHPHPHPLSQHPRWWPPAHPVPEEQRARWAHFPGAPSWGRASAASPGIHQPGGSWHGSQLCSTDSTCLFPVFPVFTESRGAGGRIRRDRATYPLWDLPHAGRSPLNPSFLFHEMRSVVPARLSSQICGCFLPEPLDVDVLCTLGGTLQRWLVPPQCW